MIESIEYKTLYAIHTMTMDKKDELQKCEAKLTVLQDKINLNPENRVVEYKYFLAKLRYDQLKSTLQELWNIEKELRYKRKLKQISILQAS
jgi:hypothetical protein